MQKAFMPAKKNLTCLLLHSLWYGPGQEASVKERFALSRNTLRYKEAGLIGKFSSIRRREEPDRKRQLRNSEFKAEHTN